jgi:hypothetical protein
LQIFSLTLTSCNFINSTPCQFSFPELSTIRTNFEPASRAVENNRIQLLPKWLNAADKMLRNIGWHRQQLSANNPVRPFGKAITYIPTENQNKQLIESVAYVLSIHELQCNALPVIVRSLTIADDQMLSRKQRPTFNRHSLVVAAASLCLPVCPSARCRCQPLQ